VLVSRFVHHGVGSGHALRLQFFTIRETFMIASTTPVGAFATCDLCDVYKNDTSGQFRVLPPVFQDYGGKASFAGPAATVQCFEDNSLVKAAVESPGQGRVLVVDGGGSVRKALVGGNLAAAAARNGWAGVLVHGAVRDVAELRATALGIRALALIPMPTEKRNQGRADLEVVIAGVVVRPGDWVYADADGIVVSDQPVHPAA
jgi:regulator of ribonuclease activity A